MKTHLNTIMTCSRRFSRTHTASQLSQVIHDVGEASAYWTMTTTRPFFFLGPCQGSSRRLSEGLSDAVPDRPAGANDV